MRDTSTGAFAGPPKPQVDVRQDLVDRFNEDDPRRIVNHHRQ